MHTLEPSGQVVAIMNEEVATQISQSVRKGNYSDVAMVPMLVQNLFTLSMLHGSLFLIIKAH